MAKEKSNDDKPEPSPAPVAAAPKPKAFVCKPSDRAPDDRSMARFKIRADNYGPRTARYIMAPDEESARSLYLEVEGIAAYIASLKANGVEKIEPPVLAVTRLPD